MALLMWARARRHIRQSGVPDGRVVYQDNHDDCASTKSLRDWLEQQRATLVAAGQVIPRPIAGDGAPPPAIDERQARIAALVTALTAEVPADDTLRTPEQAGRWLLANILDYHRREAKANWWEYFRLKDLPDDDLYDEKSGIAGLNHQGRTMEGRSRNPTDTYNYPEQETDIRADDEVHHGGQKIGTITGIDVARLRAITPARSGTPCEQDPSRPTSPCTQAFFAVRR